MKKLAIAVSIAALACAGGVVLAQTPMAGSPGGDRTATRAEALERANQMFDRVDANKDGKIDASDREARRTAAFERIDANKDGAISRAEFTALRPEMGGGMGDRMGGGRGEMRGTGGEHTGMRGHGMGGRHGSGGMMMLRMADSNRDGAVSKAEFSAAAATRFDRADSNHDGQLTPAERQAARAAMRGRMQEAMQRPGATGAAQVPAN